MEIYKGKIEKLPQWKSKDFNRLLKGYLSTSNKTYYEPLFIESDDCIELDSIAFDLYNHDLEHDHLIVLDPEKDNLEDHLEGVHFAVGPFRDHDSSLLNRYPKATIYIQDFEKSTLRAKQLIRHFIDRRKMGSSDKIVNDVNFIFSTTKNDITNNLSLAEEHEICDSLFYRLRREKLTELFVREEDYSSAILFSVFQANQILKKSGRDIFVTCPDLTNELEEKPLFIPIHYLCLLLVELAASNKESQIKVDMRFLRTHVPKNILNLYNSFQKLNIKKEWIINNEIIQRIFKFDCINKLLNSLDINKERFHKVLSEQGLLKSKAISNRLIDIGYMRGI